MTETHDKKLVQPSIAEVGESYVVTTDSDHLLIRRLESAEMDAVLALTRDKLDATVADDTRVKRVQARNRDSFWGVFQSDNGVNGPWALKGYYGFLLLNEAGGRALMDRSIDMLAPPVEHLTPDGDIPHTVYIWSMVVPGLSRICTPIVVKALGKTCAGKPLFATAGTQAGLNLMRRQGFTAVSGADDAIGGLFLFGQLGDL